MLARSEAALPKAKGPLQTGRTFCRLGSEGRPTRVSVPGSPISDRCSLRRSLGVATRTGCLCLLNPTRHPCLHLAQHHRQHVNFLLRQRQLRNNRGNLVEYLDPAFHLTAVFRALQGFISNEGEFRLAVAEFLKEGHVVRTLDSLMFDS